MRVLVCGGRNYNDAMTLDSWLGSIHKSDGIELIIHGAARGADLLAGIFATHAGIPVLTFAADWARLGRKAGSLRNQQMLDEGKPDLVVAFPGGRGTADMVQRARDAGVRVIEVKIGIQ
mgnify:CR=1 FL=1